MSYFKIIRLSVSTSKPSFWNHENKGSFEMCSFLNTVEYTLFHSEYVTFSFIFQIEFIIVVILIKERSFSCPKNTWRLVKTHETAVLPLFFTFCGKSSLQMMPKLLPLRAQLLKFCKIRPTTPDTQEYYLRRSLTYWTRLRVTSDLILDSFYFVFCSCF